jgi:phosphoribosylformylglycinamidine (FGAM) synthase-like amidotransferase family enzyme
MKFGVVVFPGSNCDHDAYHVVSKHVGQPVDFIWHKETVSPTAIICAPERSRASRL